MSPETLVFSSADMAAAADAIRGVCQKVKMVAKAMLAGLLLRFRGDAQTNERTDRQAVLFLAGRVRSLKKATRGAANQGGKKKECEGRPICNKARARIKKGKNRDRPEKEWSCASSQQ